MVVSVGVTRLLKALKLRMSAADSRWNGRPASFQSKAVLTIMSGCRLGIAPLLGAPTALVALLPLSTWPEKKPAAPGKTTELGTYCCAFSNEAPRVHQSVT